MNVPSMGTGGYCGLEVLSEKVKKPTSDCMSSLTSMHVFIKEMTQLLENRTVPKDVGDDKQPDMDEIPNIILGC